MPYQVVSNAGRVVPVRLEPETIAAIDKIAKGKSRASAVRNILERATGTGNQRIVSRSSRTRRS